MSQFVEAAAGLESSKKISPWQQAAADAMLWLVCVTLLLLFRGALIWIFHAKISPEATGEAFSRCFSTGLRFDIRWATLAILPSFLLTLVGFAWPLGRWHERVRRWLTALLMTLCAVAFTTDVAYVAEYDDQFNHWIFGLIYDDRSAIFSTIWKSYPIVRIVIIATLATMALTWAVNKLWRKAAAVRTPGWFDSGWVRFVTVILLLGLMVIGLRGSAGIRPVQLKDAARTGDVFLNKVVMNPFQALRYAIAQRLRAQSSRGLTAILPGGDVRAAAALFPATAPAQNLDDVFQRVAPGGIEPKPRHIFIVVMESYDFWSMQPGYTNLHLTDRMAAYGREGVAATAFVSSGNSTMESLGSIISGLPFAGVLVNYQSTMRQGVPTSAPQIFKRLGYRTRFFYGGYSSWQRVGDFCREQGFDDVVGGDKMSARLSGNEWGVEDEILFRYVADQTGDEPTFNVIMSTSFHPPHNLDVEAKGFPLSTLQTNSLCQGLSRRTLQVLGHLWYSDKCMGDFIEQCEKKLERPLFALTGDHFSRGECIIPRPNRFEHRAVPFVLCGRKALADVPRPAHAIAGAHIDMLPTLVNLAAPAGFVYHALGRDLLDPSQPQWGFGADTVFGTNFVLTTFDPIVAEDLRGQPLSSGVATQQLILRQQQLLGLSWWRSMKGNQWPAK